MKKLTTTEEDIMQIIWDKERCMVSEIIHSMDNPDTPHSTISSVVRILENKGFVSHKAYGRTYEYFPVISREKYAQKSFKRWFTDYFESSPDRLASFLVKEKAMDLSEIEELLIQLKKWKNR